MHNATNGLYVYADADVLLVDTVVSLSSEPTSYRLLCLRAYYPQAPPHLTFPLPIIHRPIYWSIHCDSLTCPQDRRAVSRSRDSLDLLLTDHLMPYPSLLFRRDDLPSSVSSVIMSLPLKQAQ